MVGRNDSHWQHDRFVGLAAVAGSAGRDDVARSVVSVMGEGDHMIGCQSLRPNAAVSATVTKSSLDLLPLGSLEVRERGCAPPLPSSPFARLSHFRMFGSVLSSVVGHRGSVFSGRVASLMRRSVNGGNLLSILFGVSLVCGFVGRSFRQLCLTRLASVVEVIGAFIRPMKLGVRPHGLASVASLHAVIIPQEDGVFWL